MRASFNTTCDLYGGPGSASPGIYASNVDCRLVLEDGILTVGTGAPALPFYLTIEAEEPIGAWLTGAAFGVDPALADQVAVPSGSAPQWWVIYTDQVIWLGQTPYFRSYLVGLPLPSTGGSYWLDTFTDAASVNLPSHVGENTPVPYGVPAGSFATDGAGSILATFASNVAIFTYEPGATDYTTTVLATVPFSTATRIFVLNFRNDDVNGNRWQVQIGWNGSSHTSNVIQLYSYTSGSATLQASSSGVLFDGTIVFTLVDDGNNMVITGNGKSVSFSSTLHAGNTQQVVAFVDTLDSAGWSCDYLKVEPTRP
jgi:hypothetical protein